MSNKKDKSLFGGFFNRDNNPEPQSKDDELLLCLHHLSAIGEGRDRKVDSEIIKFKKMIKIGSPASELQAQIELITNILVQSATLPDNDKLIKLFKQIPAEILIDEFLAQPISGTLKMRLQNYRNTLDKNSLATNCISDLIDMLETDIEVSADDDSEQIDISILKDITSPLLKLFSQVELSSTQNEELENMQIRLDKMNDLTELCSFIEDVSHLTLSFITTSAGKFETFLIQLKQRLDTVNNFISENRETNLAIAECSETLSHCVSTEVGHIQSSIINKSEIDNLEDMISTRLETIVEGVTSFDSVRKSLEQKAASKISDLQHELDKTRTETEHLKKNLQQQRARALTDPLTKLPNRHAYNERLHLEYNRWRRYKKPLSLIMGDIDLFKKINDTHGHLAGDTALRETAQILQQGIRETDFVARFGGEEFVILMPETNLKDATRAVNKIRVEIQNNQIHEGAANFQMTMSFGVAAFENDDTFSTVLTRADQAMYRAKAKGRNQVCVQRKKTPDSD